MMNSTQIEQTALLMLDQMPKVNIIGGSYDEVREGFKLMTDTEKTNYAISLATIYAAHLERHFKILAMLNLLEDAIGTPKAKEIAQDVRADKPDAFRRAGEFFAKNKGVVKEKATNKRNAAIDDIFEGKAVKMVNNTKKGKKHG